MRTAGGSTGKKPPATRRLTIKNPKGEPMKAKTTINFTTAQLETLKSLMLSVAYATPMPDNDRKIELYRRSDIETLAKDLTELLERAELCGITTEGEVRRV